MSALEAEISSNDSGDVCWRVIAVLGKPGEKSAKEWVVKKNKKIREKTRNNLALKATQLKLE